MNDTVKQTLNERFINALKCLQPWQDKIPNELRELNAIQRDFGERVARLSAEGRNLNIAIMGQVKAGKSTFLNALLFQGKPILPEAATPKTANLTRILYAEKPCLMVEYYSPQEWQSIVEQADPEANHAEAKAALELTLMAENSGVDIQAVLAKGCETIEAESVDDLMGRLNDYAGNNGAFTALVKMTHLRLPLEELKGYDIVDTPGMNDPVVSRTLQTQKEMARSDVVFFLSRCSQFLDATDMELLRHQLPSKGVKRLVLVGGQFDSAILDDGYDRRSLHETEQHLQKRLTERARKEMMALSEFYQEGNPELSALLAGLAEPILASTYAYVFANFPAEQWQQHAGMKHVYESLAYLALEEWQGAEWHQEDWQRVANFEPLLAAYRQARENKEKILQQQLAALVPDAERHYAEFVQRLSDSVNLKIAALQKGDVSSLAAEEKACLNQMNRIAVKLESVIGEAIDRGHEERKAISQSLQKSMREFSTLQTRIGTEEEEYSYEVSDSVLLLPWTWGRTRTVYRTRTVNYEYLSARDAAAQVAGYAEECALSIEQAFQKLVNARMLRAELRQVLADTLQTNSVDFDPQAFRNLLDNELRQLVLPDLHLSMENAGAKISSHFHGEVRGSGKMEKLQSMLNVALKEVFAELNRRFIEETDVFLGALHTVRQSLEQSLTARLQESLTQTRVELANKEANVASYQELAKAIEHLV